MVYDVKMRHDVQQGLFIGTDWFSDCYSVENCIIVTYHVLHTYDKYFPAPFLHELYVEDILMICYYCNAHHINHYLLCTVYVIYVTTHVVVDDHVT